jgi:hypothetical protein
MQNACHPERYSAKDLARCARPDASRSIAQHDWQRAIFLAVLSCCIFAVQTARAHPATLVAADVQIHRDGGFIIRARFDVLAFALNDTPGRVDDASMNALLDGPGDVLEARLKDASDRFMRGCVVLVNQDRSRVVRAESIEFPTVEAIHRWRDSGIKPRLPVIDQAKLEGHLPAGTQSVEICFPEVMGPVVMTIERPGEEPFSEPIEPGMASSVYPIKLDSSTTSPTTKTIAAAQPEPSRWRAAMRYLSLGFVHILPRGPDHILFVLGLFLLSTHLKPLLWQVTAFTIAHSITLGLALYGVVRLPSIVVEPIIALSIAFIAIENLMTTDLKPWRPVVVFAFGLVHGLGFAGVLQEMGLPRHQFATALVSFNIGVELGQLSVIALAFAIVGWWRRREWYRRAIVLPASSVIAAIAIFWTIQRVWQGI